MVEGCKYISNGLKLNKTLQVLNVKGNIIGDDGCILLADSLYNNKTLKELDISLNAIGSPGFQSICEVMQTTNIEILTCSKNFLGDATLSVFATILEDGITGSLKKFDFSS